MHGRLDGGDRVSSAPGKRRLTRDDVHVVGQQPGGGFLDASAWSSLPTRACTTPGCDSGPSCGREMGGPAPPRDTDTATAAVAIATGSGGDDKVSTSEH